MELQVRYDPDGERFVGELEGEESTLDVERWSDRILEYRRTFVPERLRARGVGRRLVRYALEWAQTSGQLVVPSCPFVKRFVQEHPEHCDLVVEGAAR